MTARPVARVGDVVTNAAAPRPGTWPVPPTATGTWMAGPVSTTPAGTTPADRITADELPVVVKAECTFTFTGTDNSSGVTVAPAPTSTITLTPGAAALHVGGNVPLLHGDTKPDTFGNTLTVVSAATWRTE